MVPLQFFFCLLVLRAAALGDAAECVGTRVLEPEICCLRLVERVKRKGKKKYMTVAF